MEELISCTDVTFEEGGSLMCTECQPHLCQDLCWMHWILQNPPWIDFLFLSLQMRSRTIKRSRRMFRAGRAALGNWLLSQAQPGHRADLTEPREWPKAIYVRKSNLPFVPEAWGINSYLVCTHWSLLHRSGLVLELRAQVQKPGCLVSLPSSAICIVPWGKFFLSLCFRICKMGITLVRAWGVILKILELKYGPQMLRTVTGI